MSIPLKFKLSTESDSAYASSKTATGNATLNVQCPAHTGSAMRTQQFSVSVGGGGSQIVMVTQEAAQVSTTLETPAMALNYATSLVVTGYSNSRRLTISVAPAATNGLSATIGTPRWLDADVEYTGSNGTQFTNGADIDGNPGDDARFKFVVPLSFASNAGNAASRSCTLSVTDSRGDANKVSVTVRQAGDAYLNVSPNSLSLSAASGSTTVVVSTNGTLNTPTYNSTQIRSVTIGQATAANTYPMSVEWKEATSQNSANLGNIGVSIVEDSEITASIPVTQQGLASGLSIVEDSSTTSVYTNHTLTLKAYLNGTLTSVDDWAVSNSHLILSSTGAGSTVTVTGYTAGSCTVTAHKNGYVVASYAVTVVQDTVARVVIEDGAASVSVRKGKSLSLMAESYLAGGTIDEQDSHVWSSADSTMASVVASGSSAGLVTGVDVTSTPVTITATSQKNSSISDTIAVNVTPAPNLILSIRLYVQRNGSNHWIAQYYQVIAQTSNGATTTKNVTVHSFDIIEDSGSETTLYTVPCNITLDLSDESNKESAQQSITAYDFGTDIEDMFTRSSDFTVNSGESESIVPTSIDDTYFDELS